MCLSRRRALLVSLAVAVVGAAGVLLAPSGERPVVAEEPRRESREPPERGERSSGAVATPTPDGDDPLWEALEETAVARLPDYAAEWSTEGRVLVRTSPAMAAAASWRVGDRLVLPVPQLGDLYRPLIEEIDDGPGLSRSALGRIRGEDGRLRRYVVTVGPAHVFAYIDTPRGPYELTGGRELGWLLPTSSMMAGFDFGEPDYILPEQWDTGDAP